MLFIIFIEIILEQFSLMYYKFFTHCNFWMIKLYFVAYFYLKIFHLEIYKHQYLAFGINFIATIIIVIKAILTIIEDKEERALYVKYHWCFILGLILFLIYAFFESYIFVLLKKIFYVNFISSSQILFFYGIIGFFVTLFLCISFTYMPCGKKIENIHEIKDYICRVTNYENQTYIDNIKIYYIENWENAEDIIKRNEILIIFIQSFSFSLFKYFCYKLLENLNPFYRIFSTSTYYLTEQLIFFVVNSNKIINDKNKYLKYKIFMDLFADILDVMTFLIYTEIIELNFCKFNYNLRKNIMLRGIINDFKQYHIDSMNINEDEDEEEEEGIMNEMEPNINNKDKKSQSSETY